MLDYDERITSTLLASRWHVAAKDHECADCGMIIRKGQQYVRQVGIVDGDFYWSDHCSSAAYCLEPDDGGH